MGFKHVKRWLAMGLLVAAPTVHGEDIDLFMGVAPPSATDLPNVLFIIDNTANWNTAFTNEKAALKAVFDGLPLDKFNIGVMMFGAPDSGYVRAAIRTMNATNRPIYSNWVNGLAQVGDRESARTLSRTMSEAHRYLAGLQSTGAGATHSKRDYTGNTGNATSTPIYGLPGNALSSSSATKYNSPLVPGSCGGTYIIYLGNTLPSGNVVKDNNARNTAARNELAAAGGDISEISLAYSSHQDNVADEWARFMKKSLGVTTYTVDVDPTPMPGGHNNGMGNSALLRSMATQSGGKYFRVDSSVGGGSEIADALNSILNEIQAVNSVFASASLPVSVNTQGTYLNQVFIGMFRPDPKAAPRWKGNLKQYKFLASVQGSGYALNLVDADEELAINNNTGFITQCARSFWTPDKASLDTYWNYPGSETEGQCSTVAGSTWSNTPDGEVVEKGAAGYQLRATSPSSRNVKTCAGCTDGSALTSFEAGNVAISTTALGAADTTERNNIINWTRGNDIFDEDADLNITEMRPSALGDVVHSRPVAVDYGGTTGVVVFYGANDGMLHAVDGNQVGTGAGRELWSFVAPEQYGRLKRIYKNDLAITFPSVGDATAKPYFFDGPVTATKDGSTVRIFATQRRGGRMVYAFDVSSPAAPTLLWRRGCTTPLGNDAGCMTDFDGIGQTWSAPKPLKAEGYASGATKLPMLIMGGGYDTCEDAEPNTCSSPKGNKVYVLDEASGTLLKTFTTDRSVVGDVTVVPNKATGLADLAYLTDSGGNIYRIDIGTAAPSAWTITKIAAVGCGTPSCSAGTANRKFLFAPEVVVMTQYPGQYAVLVGSGDREHPLKSNIVTAGVQNAFFMVMDKPTEATWLSEEATSNCGGQPVICLNSLTAISNTGSNPDPETLDKSKGWYLTLSPTEQVVTSAVVLFGEATFSTHMPAAPAPGSCSSNLGIARVYNVTYLDGASLAPTKSRFDEISGGGLPPSPVSGLVTVDNPTTGQPMTVPFIIGASKESPVEVMLKSGSSGVAGNKERVYWYIEQ